VLTAGREQVEDFVAKKAQHAVYMGLASVG